jgi:hypothetical protein
MRVEDQPSHLVHLIGNHRLLKKRSQWQISQRHLRGHPLHSASSGNARQLIARARR